MAKKKPVHQPKRQESEMERLVRKEFDQAGRLAKKMFHKSDSARFCDLTGQVLKRRKEAVLRSLEAVKERYAAKYPKLNVEHEWILFCRTLAPSADIEDHERFVAYAMALTMLDDLVDYGNLKKLLHFLIRNDDEHEEIEYVPDGEDSRHEKPLIRGLMHLIYERNGEVDEDEKHFLNEIEAARTDHDLFGEMNLETIDSGDPNCTIRQRFNIAMHLVTDTKKERAMRHFTEKVWEYMDLYFREMEKVVVEIDKAWEKSDNLIQRMEQINPAYRNLPAQLAPTLDPHMCQDERMARIFQAVQDMTDAMKHQSPGEIKQYGDLVNDLMRYEDKAEHLTTLSNHFSVMAPLIPGMPYEIVERDLGQEIADAFQKFDVGDPFEICFGYLCLLESGSDIPWLYCPANVILKAAARKLPWCERPMTDEELDEMDQAEEDTTPYDYEQNPLQKSLYDLQYLDSFHCLPEGTPNPKNKVNLAQLVYSASGVVMPRTVLDEGTLRRDYLRAGVNPELAQALELYSELAENATNRAGDVVSDLLSWDYQRLMQQLGLTGKTVNETETEMTKLREELRETREKLKALQKENHLLEQDANKNRKAAEQTREEAEMEHRELLDLRELIYNLENGEEETEEVSDPAVSFPYVTKKRTVVFGGHDTWSKAIRPMLPGVTFIPRGQNPNAEMIRGADVVWLQANAMAHKDFYKIMNVARAHRVPIRYFGFASASKCAAQLAKADMKEE